MIFCPGILFCYNRFCRFLFLCLSPLFFRYGRLFHEGSMVQVGMFVLYRTVVANIVDLFDHYMECLRALADFYYDPAFGCSFDFGPMVACLPPWSHDPYSIPDLNPYISDDDRVVYFQAYHWFAVLILHRFGVDDQRYQAYLSNLSLLSLMADGFVQGLFGDIFHR